MIVICDKRHYSPTWSPTSLILKGKLEVEMDSSDVQNVLEIYNLSWTVRLVILLIDKTHREPAETAVKHLVQVS